MLCEDEIAARLPVWTALSDLFLDTELDERSYDHIAQVIRAAGLTGAQAHLILETEVAPAFYVNFAAGEWAGWPEASVRTEVLRYLNGGWFRRGCARLGARISRAMYWDAWSEVARRLD